MRFRVDLELGNDGVLTTADVASALERTAAKVRDYADPPHAGEGGRVVDRNGNSVGEWRFEGPRARERLAPISGARERAWAEKVLAGGRAPPGATLDAARYDAANDEVVFRVEADGGEWISRWKVRRS